MQPKIDWKRGWIDHTQLPIVLKAGNAKRAHFVPQTRNIPWPVHKDQYFIGRVIFNQERNTKGTILGLPEEYQRHHKIFSEQESQRLPGHTIWDHAIKLLPGTPTTLPGQLLPLTQAEIEEAKKFVDEYLKQGTIRPSWSPYAANFFFVKKKDGKLRPIQDYQPLNKWTKRNRNISPLIPQVIDWLNGSTLFTKFDIHWGYNNIRIKKGNEWKGAFLMPKGLFEPLVMFFRLTNSLATFQMMMNTIFRRPVMLGWFSIFMDDSIIYTVPLEEETHEEHLARHQKYVHEIFDILEKNDLYAKIEKCTFKQEEIKYLGVVISKGEIKMDPKKLKGVADWPVPQTVTKVRAFLGFTSYYWYFVQDYLCIARPLLDLTKKMEKWHWGEAQTKVFKTLKTKMCLCPVLKQPNFNKRFFLQTDASKYGMGAILSQEGEHMPASDPSKQLKPKLHPITYYLATFIPAKWNYNIYERELLAVMKSLAHWRQYLDWTKEPFTILTDHTNLQYWKSPRNLNW